MICWTWKQNVALSIRQHYVFRSNISCWPNPLSIIVLLYLHWFRMNIVSNLYINKLTMIKQTDHDQTNWPWSNWPKLGRIDLGRKRFCVNWLLHHHICPRHPGCGEQQIHKLRTNWFQTKWIKNKPTCLWSPLANIYFLFPPSPTSIFICPLLQTFSFQDFFTK